VAVKDALFYMSADANFDTAPLQLLVVVCNCVHQLHMNEMIDPTGKRLLKIPIENQP